MDYEHLIIKDYIFVITQTNVHERVYSDLNNVLFYRLLWYNRKMLVF